MVLEGRHQNLKIFVIKVSLADLPYNYHYGSLVLTSTK